jgi:chromosome segregation ATPase
MTNTPIQVTTDLSKILEQINQKLDNLDQKFETKLDNLEQKFETKLDNLDKKFETKLDNLSENVKSLSVDMATVKTELGALKDDVKEVKGSSKAQIWTLIGILGTAVVGTVIRFVITAIPSKP